MKLARVVHSKKEPYDVLIDRTTVWGNPFIVGKDGTRDAVCNKFERWFPLQAHLVEKLPELIGKTLGCHCAPLRCHGDYLAKRVNELQFQLLTGEKNV